MLQRIQHRRFTDPAGGWPVAVMPGEVSVNPVRRTMAVGDIDGTPREFIGVPVYDQRSAFVAGNLVVRSGTILQANTNVAAGTPFNPASWDPVTHTLFALDNRFDDAYALIDHLHTGVYAPTTHEHSQYSLTTHTHDANYATASHNHDGTYAKLTGGNNFGAGVNSFADIVNLGGSYTAVYGALSVSAGAPGFPPGHALHVRTNIGVTAAVESTGGNVAQLLLGNMHRQYLLRERATGDYVDLVDLSGGDLILQSWGVGGVGSAVWGDLSVFNMLRVTNVTLGGFVMEMGRGPVGGISADYLRGSTGYIAWQTLPGPQYICDISPGGVGPGLPAPIHAPGTSGLRILPGEMQWNGSGPTVPIGHTFLRDGILTFRAFADTALPSFSAYPGALVFSATVPGRMWMTNDGLSWKQLNAS